MSICADKLREAHANLSNATLALRDARCSDGCSLLLDWCILDQIAASSQTQRQVERLLNLTQRDELQNQKTNTKPEPPNHNSKNRL